MEEPPFCPHLAWSERPQRAAVPLRRCLCSSPSCPHSFYPGSISHLVPGNLTQRSVGPQPNPDVSIHLFLAFRRSHLLPGSHFPFLLKNGITGIKKGPGPSSSNFPSQTARVLSTLTFHAPHLASFKALVVFCFIGSGLLVGGCRSECKAKCGDMCLSSQHWGGQRRKDDVKEGLTGGLHSETLSQNFRGWGCNSVVVFKP